MVLSWWQIKLLRIGWYFTKRAYGAGLGDKIEAEVARLDDDDGRSGKEKFEAVKAAVRLDIDEAPGELKTALVETADWVLGDMINGAVGVLRAEQGAALTRSVGL